MKTSKKNQIKLLFASFEISVAFRRGHKVESHLTFKIKKLTCLGFHELFIADADKDKLLCPVAMLF